MSSGCHAISSVGSCSRAAKLPSASLISTRPTVMFAPGGDIAGIAVHIASRILATYAPNQILVSGTIPDLAIGPGLHLEERGIHKLKGVEGDWQLFAAYD
jgi:class 3 adenylate cyclase